MARQTVVSSADTFVDGRHPDTNYSGGSWLWLGGSNALASYVFWPKFWPTGAVVTNATLRLVVNTALNSETRTFQARRITGPWSVSKTTANKAPTTGATVAATTVTGAQARFKVVEIDVTTLVQQADSVGQWLGLHLFASGAGQIISLFGAASSSAEHRPRLTVEWSDAPNKPTGLSPSSGRVISDPTPLVRASFLDVGGDTTLQAVQVRSYWTTEDAWNDIWPRFDSGVVPSSHPQLDLGAAGHDPLTPGEGLWWRMKTQDGAGLWSPWSDVAISRYVAVPQPVLDDPTGSVVYDATPPIVFHPTVATPTQQRLMITGPDGLIAWDTGWTPYTPAPTTTVTVPAGVITAPGVPYTVWVELRDGESRETIPGGTAYGYVTREITYVPDSTETAPTGLAATQDAPGPLVVLSWARSTAPDSWTILRDGKVIVSGAPAESMMAGAGAYSYTDGGSAPGVPHTYEVRAVVNDHSSGAATTTITTKVDGLWIVDPAPGGLAPVVIADTNEGSWKLASNQAWHEPIGAANSVLITGAQRGYEATLSGDLLDRSALMPDVTAEQLRDRFLAFRNAPGKVVHVVGPYFNIRAVLSDLAVSPTPDREQRWAVGFSFREQL